MAKYRCPGCEYIYDEERGDAHEGHPPGTLFASLLEDFTCPDCSVRYKEDFEEMA
ncbi:MAG: rubredoxin [Halioglobus sp.]|jgi:rubredoxin